MGYHKLMNYSSVEKKVLNQERISDQEALSLYDCPDLTFLGYLANQVKVRWSSDDVFFNRNFHIEPTNICVFDCKFCSYSRAVRERGNYDAWEMSEEEMYKLVESYKDSNVTEVHIVGGVHPKMGLQYFADILLNIKKINPQLHIKAFTAVELEYMFRKAKLSIKEGLMLLKNHGLDSIPGGGAEIFDTTIREIICKDKCTSEEWLEIHKTAHQIGVPSNATMLYGHYENYTHRVDHMRRLRELQDETNGFNTFIPLKYRNQNNDMSELQEVSMIEDLKNYAIARIYLDNFPHLKAYWPMIGRESAQLALNYGVDDMDGTIDDSTKIYSMAGSEEQNPAISTEELVRLIHKAGKNAVERDTLYQSIKRYDRRESFVTN